MTSHRKAPEKRPALGYTLYSFAALLWALNGTVAVMMALCSVLSMMALVFVKFRRKEVYHMYV